MTTSDIFRSFVEKGIFILDSKDFENMLPREKTEFLDGAVEIVINQRMKVLDDNIGLFTSNNILTYPKDEPQLVAAEMHEGSLYEMSLEDHRAKAKLHGSERFDYQLLLQVTRDGERLIVPIYKLFFLIDNRMTCTVVGSNLPIEFDVEQTDSFLLVKGDTFRTVIRQIKKQAHFKDRMRLEHAGNAGGFDEDQI